MRCCPATGRSCRALPSANALLPSCLAGHCQALCSSSVLPSHRSCRALTSALNALSGAGYAAINALNAASKYMTAGQRVIVVDRGYRWGGHWPDQYSYVRLHQGFRNYAVGERDWTIDRPDDHLATKDEILMYFDEAVKNIIAETGIEILELFGYEYCSDYAVAQGKVCFTAKALVEGAADVTVTAGKMINGKGFDLHPKLPLTFGAEVDNRLHSLIPGDIASKEARALMCYPKEEGGLIVVVGSGKTAMDCMIKLAALGDSVTSRLRCISGRGTWFTVREVFGSPQGGGHMVSMMDLFDGHSGKEVLREMGKRGFLHSPLADPSSFQVGVCSRWEVELVEQVLSPQEEKVCKAHLIDVTADASTGGTVLHMRPVPSGDHWETADLDSMGAELTTMALPQGSFLINCTDHIGEHANIFDPIVSDDGLVLSPQAALGFSGPSAHALTHAWYLDVLGDTWRGLLRMTANKDEKANFGIGAFFQLIFAVQAITALLPPELVANSAGLNLAGPSTTGGGNKPLSPEAAEAAKAAGKMMAGIYQKSLALFPERYTDSEQYELKGRSVLMGKIGTQSGTTARL